MNDWNKFHAFGPWWYGTDEGVDGERCRGAIAALAKPPAIPPFQIKVLHPAYKVVTLHLFKRSEGDSQ